MRLSRNAVYGIGGCGFALLVAGIASLFVIQGLINAGIRNAVVVDSPDADGYEAWQSDYKGRPSQQVYHMFNITNPDEVLAGEPPVLTRMGPYVYDRYTVKVDPHFENDGEDAQYYEMTQYFFNAEESRGLESDVVTNVYPFYMGVMNQAGNDGNFLMGMSSVYTIGIIQLMENMFGDLDSAYLQWGSLGMTGENLTPDEFELPSPTRNISLSVEESEALLNGTYGLSKDPANVAVFMQLIADRNEEALLARHPEVGSLARGDVVASYIMHLATNILPAQVVETVTNGNCDIMASKSVHEWLWEFRDALLDLVSPASADLAHLQTNDTSENEVRETKGRTSIKTGAGELEDARQMQAWNGMTSEATYSPPVVVTGTDGTQFVPNTDADDTINAYVSEVRRPLTLTSASEEDVKGITTNQFRLVPELLEANPQYNTDTRGIFNVTAFSNLVPIELSKPFFLDADPTVPEAVGMEPAVRERDETVLCVEPLTGAVVKADLRLQISTRVLAGKHQTFHPNIYEALYPIVTIERTGIISDEDADTFKSRIYGGIDTKWTVFGVLMGVGGLLVFVIAPLCWFCQVDGRYEALGEGVPLRGRR